MARALALLLTLGSLFGFGCARAHTEQSFAVDAPPMAQDGGPADAPNSPDGPLPDGPSDGPWVADAPPDAAGGDAPTTDGGPLELPLISTTSRTLCTGARHACAIVAAGKVKCWGANYAGQTGYGVNTLLGDEPGEVEGLPSVELGTGLGASALALTCGASHTCALLASGQVKCWGKGTALGLGATSDRGKFGGDMGDALPALDFGTSSPVVQVEAGAHSTCARFGDGSVRCWGEGSEGQLGSGSTDDIGDEPGEMGAALQPLAFGPGRSAVGISAGEDFACAVLDNGEVTCWGSGVSGRLGLGTQQARGDQPGEMGAAPLWIELGMLGPTMLATGGSHACAATGAGALKCWGENWDGQLGLGHSSDLGDGPGEMGTSLPWVYDFDKLVRLAAGSESSCALTKLGAVYCWGDGTYGVLGRGDMASMGDGSGEMAQLQALDFGTDEPVLELEMGDYFACVRFGSGSIKCWGENGRGQLGLGDTNHRGNASGEMGDALPYVPVAP